MAQLLGDYSLEESNITVFGDSISKGLYLKGDRINRLEINAVQLVMDKYGIDIDNKSAFGQSLQRIYNKKVIEKYLAEIDHSRHNIAVLSLGGNDADYNWTEVAKNPTAIHDSKTPLFFFGKWLDETIRMLQSNRRACGDHLSSARQLAEVFRQCDSAPLRQGSGTSFSSRRHQQYQQASGVFQQSADAEGVVSRMRFRGPSHGISDEKRLSEFSVYGRNSSQRKGTGFDCPYNVQSHRVEKTFRLTEIKTCGCSSVAALVFF